MSRQQKDIKSKKISNISKLINGIFFTKTWIYQKFAQSSLFIHFHIKKIRANNTWTFSRSKNQITHHFHHPSENHSLAPTPGSKHKKKSQNHHHRTPPKFRTKTSSSYTPTHDHSRTFSRGIIRRIWDDQLQRTRESTVEHQ